MKNIFKTSLLIVLSCLMAGSVWGANSDFTVSLSEFTKTGNTYEVSYSQAQKVQGCIASIEVPSADAAGSIGFMGTGKYEDRLIYIFGNAGTTADKSRKADMSKTEYKTISFTSADIATENGKYYLKFSSDQDYKFTKVQYILDKGGEGQKSTDATLKDLKVDGETIEGFDSDQLTYNAEYENGAAQLPEITATPTDEGKATVEMTTEGDLSDAIVKIKVTAEDGITTKTYIITFTEGPPTSFDATLKDLQVNGKTIDGFAPTTFQYTYTVKASSKITTLEVTATKSDQNASEPDITQAAVPTEGVNTTATIKVTAEDGNTTLTYKITFVYKDNYVKVFTIDFPNQVGEATIVHGTPDPDFPETLLGGTIKAKIKYNSELTITPNFEGQNIDDWIMKGSQDFSEEYVPYTFSSKDGPTSSYKVTITKAPEVKPNDITLNKEELTLTEGGSEALTATVGPEDADDKSVTWESDDEEVATVDENGKVTAVAPGIATITAKADRNDQVKTTCKVTVEEEEEEEEIPQTDLTIHVPEVYENAAAQGGYGKALTKVTVDGKEREFEVYYFSNQNSTPYFNAGASHLDNPAGYELANSTTFNIGWLDAKVGDLSGSSTLNKDEFIGNGSGAKVHYAKVTKDHMIKLHVKGFDQFSFIGREAGDKDNKFFKVSINGVEQTFAHSKSDNTIYRFELKDGKEYYIEVTGTSSDENRFRAFSLRIANIPLVRHISGPQDQTVYQTDNLQPVVYRVRRAKSYRLNWGNGNTGIPGVTALAGTNDTVFIQGIANAPVGKYTYTLEALDEQDNVASQESGTITIETHIDDCADGNDRTTNVAEEMKPLTFRYYAMNVRDISFSCDISGLNIAFDEQNQIATISGVPAVVTTEGPHTYTLAVAGGNTVTGTITIVVPDPIFGPIPSAKTKDGQEITFYFVVHHAKNVTISGLPNGFTVNYNPNNDTVTVKGTPNVGSGYPKAIEYTVTATPRYTGKQSKTEKGKLTVLDPNAKAIMMVTKETTNDDLDPLSQYFVDEGYDITCVLQDDIKKVPMDAFGLIIITDEADADHKDVLNLIREGEKPVLNMKGFTYAAGRLGWGEPDNGTKDTLTNHAAMIYVQNEHPIFESLNKEIGDSIKLFDAKKLSAKYMNGVMPIKVFGDSIPGSYCLATGYTRNISDYFVDGPKETAIHEVPVSAREGAEKYICFPLALQSLEYMTDDGLELVRNIADYLMGDQNVKIEAPVLQLNSLRIGDYEAEIDQDNNYIILEITDKVYDSLDSLRHITPVVELEDPVHTHWTPVMPVDLMTSYLIKYPYFAVSDYINRRQYEFKLKLQYSADRGLDEVYAEGDWITLYDIYGRIIATTNESIYTMDLPRGMYIAVTASGHTIKLMR